MQVLCETLQPHNSQMTKDTLTSHRILYALLLVTFDVVGLIMVDVVFLGASNANGEGAPIESAFIGFLRQVAYVIIVSLFFSLIAFLLTRVFHYSLSKKNWLIKNVFWVHLGGMLAIFLLSYLYLWLTFAL
jgi:hypothetical protein